MTTLTYQPEQQPEFSEEELDSIQVGEQLSQEQDRALAGKFESAEELEKAYLELQNKFSSQQPVETEEQPQQEYQEEEGSDLSFLDTLWEEAQSEYSEETLEQLGNMDAADVAQMYLEYRNSQGEETTQELSPNDVENLYGIVGGQDEYNNMVRWAGSELDPSEVELYDGVMNSGNPAACFFAVQALAYRWSEVQGWQGSDFLSGNAAPTAVDSFRSQAEVVQAMSDPRYDNDPAYRQDVMNKLERSADLMY
jgi:hypothetical protein